MEDSVTPLVKGDYYIENGLMVFTEQYHLKRGFCCKNDCRHCPYRATLPKGFKPLGS